MRHKPIGKYNGITVVLSNPSRFDKASLLSSTGGWLFSEFLKPLSRYQCDIRLKEDKTPLLNNTKCILLLGQPAMHSWCPNTIYNTLNELRGTPLSYNGTPAIASYLPQDAADIKNYEAEFNPQSFVVEDESDRKNFGFWLSNDIHRIKLILAHNGIPQHQKPEYIIYPSSAVIIEILQTHKGETFFIDIETDSELNILCFSFSFGLPYIYVVPCVNHNYEWAYQALPSIVRALGIAMHNNTTVAHNGSKFDFLVLADKYKIPPGLKLYDTLLAMHRCFPEVEKSLGHCCSMWTWLPFHKDEGGGGYNSEKQAKDLWAYCGKDVYAMVLIKEAIDRYAKTIPGLSASIKQANDSIRPYLLMTLQGIRYEKHIIDDIWNENDRLMKQYLRMLEILIGKENLTKIRGSGKSVMPTSNTQCCKYFHEMLGYPVIATGKEKQDGTRNPSLGKKAIFKLRLKFENPVLDLIIAYREIAKESSSLKFTPWKV